jgi:large repetitive protein
VESPPTPPPSSFCGDGFVDFGEECDDGNFDDSDACSNQCTVNFLTFCGDGFVDFGEECDDGNFDDSDACSNQCTVNFVTPDPVCGNGIIDLDAGEECDDGNTDDTDGCRNDCTTQDSCGDTYWERLWNQILFGC